MAAGEPRVARIDPPTRGQTGQHGAAGQADRQRKAQPGPPPSELEGGTGDDGTHRSALVDAPDITKKYEPPADRRGCLHARPPGWQPLGSGLTPGSASVLLRPRAIAQIAATGRGGERMAPKTDRLWPNPAPAFRIRGMSGYPR